MRFRKSVKLGPGVRVNISKSGISTSVGPRGFTTSIGKKGIYQNIGIPGTGASLRTKLMGESPSGVKGSADRAGSAVPAAIREWQAYTGESNPSVSFALDAHNGEIVFVDKNGEPISDPKLMSIIKRTPQYKEQLPTIKERQREAIAKIVEERERENASFIKAYVDSPAVLEREAFEQKLKLLAPQRYKPVPFETPAPSLNDVRNKLMAESELVVKGAPWKRRKLRERYVAEREEERLGAITEEWRSLKADFEAAEFRKAKSLNAQYDVEFEQQRQLLEASLRGDRDYIEEMSEERIAVCELPVEIATQFEYRPDEQCLMVDLDLPEIEDLPMEVSVQTANGQLRVKAKTQKALRMEYAECVFGLAVFVAANLFNVSPEIRAATVSGYTRRRNKVGDLVDDYILSIKFNRETFYHVNYQTMDPEAFCMSFENRCNVTSTKVFKAIEPYE